MDSAGRWPRSRWKSIYKGIYKGLQRPLRHRNGSEKGSDHFQSLLSVQCTAGDSHLLLTDNISRLFSVAVNNIIRCRKNISRPKDCSCLSPARQELHLCSSQVSCTFEMTLKFPLVAARAWCHLTDLSCSGTWKCLCHEMIALQYLMWDCGRYCPWQRL